MMRTIPQQVPESPHRAVRPAMMALATTAGLLVAGAVALWAHYGTAVFYESILAGINACF